MGYEGEGPALEDVSTINVLTLNMHQDAASKIPVLLPLLEEEGCDIALLSETGVGVNVGDLCKEHIGLGAQGFKPYATNKKDAGVTILIRRDWEPLVIGKPTVIKQGRAVSIRIALPGDKQILIVGLYQKSAGLEKLNAKHPDYLSAKSNIDSIVAAMDEQVSLVIVGGDMNDCDDVIRDRQRPPTVEDRGPRSAPCTFQPLLDAGFRDSHLEACPSPAMTCTTTLKGGIEQSHSRIDRIFFWSDFHANCVSAHTSKAPFTTNHKALSSSLLVAIEPTTLHPAAPPTHPQLNFKRANEAKKVAFAGAINDMIKPRLQTWSDAIAGWEHNMDLSNQTIESFTKLFLNLATSFFAKNQATVLEEAMTRKKLKDLRRLIRNIDTLRQLDVPRFPKRKSQKRFENAVRRLPLHLRDSRTVVNSLWRPEMATKPCGRKAPQNAQTPPGL